MEYILILKIQLLALIDLLHMHILSNLKDLFLESVLMFCLFFPFLFIRFCRQDTPSFGWSLASGLEELFG